MCVCVTREVQRRQQQHISKEGNTPEVNTILLTTPTGSAGIDTLRMRQARLIQCSLCVSVAALPIWVLGSPDMLQPSVTCTPLPPTPHLSRLCLSLSAYACPVRLSLQQHQLLLGRLHLRTSLGGQDNDRVEVSVSGRVGGCGRTGEQGQAACSALRW